MAKQTKPKTEPPITDPAPTYEDVFARQAKLVNDIAGLRAAIKARLAKADELDDQAALAGPRSERLAANGDTAGRDELLRSVPDLRRQADELREGLADFRARAAALEEQARTVRAAAGEMLLYADAQFEAAKDARLRAAKLYGDAGAAGDLGHLRNDLAEWSGLVDEPEPADEAAPATAPTATAALPNCPRCKRADKVVRVNGHDYECTRGWHGRLRFSHRPRELAKV